jgi:3'-phosphoadenosine 5'-phosphosulfate sulfotransferase (PAPS reductase)/FAD synthetase
MKLRILSLGAGVQSSALAMLIEQGKVPMVDAAIFADVGAEPREVIEWLDWLKTKISYPLFVVQDRNLKEDLELMASGKYKKIPIPIFTLNEDGKKGMNRRACTSDYKIKPVTQKIRQLLGLAKGERRKNGTEVELLMGISTDEVQRMKTNQIKYFNNVYPLIDMGWNRSKCISWFEENYNKIPPRSACTFCPFHSNEEWKRVKSNKEEWDKVVALEKSFIENKELITKTTGMKDTMFLSRKCVPIDQVDFDENKNKDQLDMFNNECEGMCGV